MTAGDQQPAKHVLSGTEGRNPASGRLDEMGTMEMLQRMNAEDRKVPETVEKALPRIAEAVELLVEAWRAGGRWIYVGAGTSGRIAALDAAECPPTFGVPPGRVVALVAGGQSAATSAVEGAEDDREAAGRDLEALELRPPDVVVGLAASGRTPYVVSAVRRAAEAGCVTVGISNNEGTELSTEAGVAIDLLTGPEVLTGSTRLKAGTSQKLVLNMLSTAAFTRLGRVHENLMVDMRAANEKLERRSRRIVSESVGVTEGEAEDLLLAANGSARVALVMGKTGLSETASRKLLDDANGSVRRALEATRRSTCRAKRWAGFVEGLEGGGKP
jgi:N-acetylmuramic acid 6-phosphate etherase